MSVFKRSYPVLNKVRQPQGGHKTFLAQAIPQFLPSSSWDYRQKPMLMLVFVWQGGYATLQPQGWAYCKILDKRSTPIINSLGHFLFRRRQQAKFYASFRRHYLDFLALFPLKNFTLPDGLTTGWQVDISVTRVGNLERIHSENICL